MLKIDYEKAWKDLKNGTAYNDILDFDNALGFSIQRPNLIKVMNKLEKKHTLRNISEKEVNDV